jgi:hypothetical protein
VTVVDLGGAGRDQDIKDVERLQGVAHARCARRGELLGGRPRLRNSRDPFTASRLTRLK